MKKPCLHTSQPSRAWGGGGRQAQDHCTSLRNPVHLAVCVGVQSPRSTSAGGQSQEVWGVFREPSPAWLLMALGPVHSLWFSPRQPLPPALGR